MSISRGAAKSSLRFHRRQRMQRQKEHSPTTASTPNDFPTREAVTPRYSTAQVMYSERRMNFLSKICKKIIGTDPQWHRELFAETLGTFWIVWLGTGLAFTSLIGALEAGLFQIASLCSIAVILGILMTGFVSCAHLNPAMSLAFYCFRRQEVYGTADKVKAAKKMAFFVLFQVLGAALASCMNLALYKDSLISAGVDMADSMAAFGEYFSISPLAAFRAESIGTFILTIVVFGITNRQTKVPPVLVAPLIGITVGALICLIAPLTQAGFNPARDFGPRLVAAFLGGYPVKEVFRGWWVYALAPLVGSVAGGWIVDRVLFPPRNNVAIERIEVMEIDPQSPSDNERIEEIEMDEKSSPESVSNTVLSY